MWFDDYLAAWEDHDVDAVTAWVTDDIVFEDVALGHRVEGIDAFRNFVAAGFDSYPDVRFEVTSRAELGDRYAVEWTMHPMGVRGASMGRLHDGLIAEQRDYWNDPRS